MQAGGGASTGDRACHRQSGGCSHQPRPGCNSDAPDESSANEARRNLVEEAADVYNVLGLLLDAEDNAEIYSIIRRKKERWLKRLEG